MNVTLHPATEARIQHQLDRGVEGSAEDVINRALDLLEAQDSVSTDWLLENQDAIRADLAECESLEQQGQSYSAEEARAILAERRAARVS